MLENEYERMEKEAKHFDYSISTLRFGMNAKKIETKVLANINY